MEIGVSAGGTLALWSQLAHSQATLIGLDISITPEAESRIRRQMRDCQLLHLVQADSHDRNTKEKVVSLLGENQLDFLFIDGDHSYEGVKQDWEVYSALMRPGGLIAFHDIVPDHYTRWGMETRSDAGGVHRLWNEIKGSFRINEFIENTEQDGYGLGVIKFAKMKQI